MIFSHHHPNSLICREPAKYSQVVQSLKEGKGVIQIAVEQGLSKSTVQTIREKNRDIFLVGRDGQPKRLETQELRLQRALL